MPPWCLAAELAFSAGHFFARAGEAVLIVLEEPWIRMSAR